MSAIASILVVNLVAAVGRSAALPGLPPSQRSPAADVLGNGHAVISLGPRPYYLVNNMDAGPLKDHLQACGGQAMRASRFSIAHRGGGTLQVPEETAESLAAGTLMGAGVLECDVAFTADRQLVCRHSVCDLHSTTDIVATPLGAKCKQPWVPASGGKPAHATCCTSDISLAEFKTLCGKMDGVNVSATTPEDYLHGTPAWRTDLYSTCGTVLSHRDFIAIVQANGLDFTPELKMPADDMPLPEDYGLEVYAQQLVDDYRAAGVDFARVWPQSFRWDVIRYWLEREPVFASQAVLLVDESGHGDTVAAMANLTHYKEAGVRIMGPPLPYLLTLGDNGTYVPSPYALEAKRLDLELMTWTLERSGPLASVAANKDYYFISIANGTTKDGDLYRVVDALVKQVGVRGIFSDWSSTVTYYANCLGLFP